MLATHSRRAFAAATALAVVLAMQVNAQEPVAEPDAQGPPGYDWTQVRDLPGQNIPVGITTFGPATVLVGTTRRGAGVSISADDGTWTTIRLPGPRRRASAVDATSWQGGLAVVGSDQVGQGRRARTDGLIWTSPDGAAWTRTARIRNASLHGIHATPDGIVVVGTASRGARSVPTVWHSSDGVEWQASAIDDPVAGTVLGMDVARSEDGTWLACYYEFDEEAANVSHHLRRSVDGGVSWGPGTGPAAASRECGNLEAMPSGFLMAITAPPDPDWAGSTLWHSADGETWQDVATIQGTFVPIGGHPAFTLAHESDAAGQITLSVLGSSDGIDWDEISAPALGTESIRALYTTTGPDGRIILVTSPAHALDTGGFVLLGDPSIWIGEPLA